MRIFYDKILFIKFYINLINNSSELFKIDNNNSITK